MMLISLAPAWAFGDFPAASCKGAGGTVTEKKGVDTTSALLKGLTTKADLQEYCERDLFNETEKPGLKLKVAQCVAEETKRFAGAQLSSDANCRTGNITFHYFHTYSTNAKFPLSSDADTSCGSGMPPVIAQFKMLCPAAAKRMRLE